MKLFILSLLVLITSAESFAQVRGPRYNPPGGRRNDRIERRHGPVVRHERRVENRGPVFRSGPVVVVRPRYIPRYDSRRVIRTIRRSPMIWSSGFGYTCDSYGDLRLNGRPVHNFRFGSDCYTALEDVRIYGDFCDQEDLYDQSGMLEAQFNYNYECREALGYFY